MNIRKSVTGRHLGLIGLASLLCLAAGPTAQVHGPDGHGTDEQACTQESLEGAYGYILSGLDGPATLNGGNWSGPVAAAVGLMTFDGAGGLTVRETRATNGAVSRRTGTGTYSVGVANFPQPPSLPPSRAKCMGSAILGEQFSGLSFDFMIVPASEGSELSLIITNPGKIQTGVASKTGDDPCSNASLEGTYRVQSAGGISLENGPTAAVGFRILDGAGNLTWAEDTLSREVAPPGQNQVVHRIGRSATFRVLSDCTVSEVFIAPAPADRATFEGVVVAGGREAYFVRTGPDRTGRPDRTGPLSSSYKRW